MLIPAKEFAPDKKTPVNIGPAVLEPRDGFTGGCGRVRTPPNLCQEGCWGGAIFT